jgi:manganese/zinc/iron transport system permease protein
MYAFLGSFLTLFKNSFIVDSIGHSIVAGIAIGFLFSKSLDSSWLLIFAILSSFCMLCINEYLIKNNISKDAALGISFSILFSFGILLISLYARNIHLDIDMILLGNIEYAVYDGYPLFGVYLPKIIIELFMGGLFFLLFLWYFFSQIKIIMFDSEFAKMKGIPISLIVYSFISVFSALVVLTFHVMGSLLLLGIAVAPFGFAWHQSRSYEDFVIFSLLGVLLSSLLGVTMSLYCNTSISATITFIVTSASLCTYFLRRYIKQ